MKEGNLAGFAFCLNLKIKGMRFPFYSTSVPIISSRDFSAWIANKKGGALKTAMVNTPQHQHQASRINTSANLGSPYILQQSTFCFTLTAVTSITTNRMSPFHTAGTTIALAVPASAELLSSELIDFTSLRWVQFCLVLHCKSLFLQLSRHKKVIYSHCLWFLSCSSKYLLISVLEKYISKHENGHLKEYWLIDISRAKQAMLCKAFVLFVFTSILPSYTRWIEGSLQEETSSNKTATGIHVKQNSGQIKIEQLGCW